MSDRAPAGPERSWSGAAAGHGRRTRLILADDHTLVREPLREFLETAGGFEVLAEAADGEEAVRLVRELRPDVLLLDIAMPGLDGLQVTEILAASVPETRILVLSGYESPQQVRSAARLGAAGYVVKTARFEELARAIQAVQGGQLFFPASVAPLLRAGPGSEPVPTQRELEVLRLVEQGLRNRDIAARLSISEATVQFHLRQLFAKLGAGSRTEATHRARERGWIV